MEPARQLDHTERYPVSWEDRFSAKRRLMDDSGIRAILGVASRPGTLSFAGGLPDPKLLPIKHITECAEIILRDHGRAALQYGVADGTARLTECLAKLSRSRGAESSSQNILPTTGSQQGIDLLANALLNQGDTIAVTRPTYLGALQIFSAFEPRYLEISCDDEGPILAEVEAALREEPAFFYLVSMFQNPTGGTISEKRGEAIVRLCHHYDVPIVEDAAYRELFYDEPPASLRGIESTMLRRNGQRYEVHGRVLYLGTLSKVMSPGLRVGWIEAPSTVIRGLACLKQGNDLHSATFNQLIAAEFIERFAEDYWNEIRHAYRERRDQAVASARKHLGPRLSDCTNPKGGFFLWVEVDPRINTSELLAHSVENFGVAFAPGAPFFARNPDSNTMRVSFSNLSPIDIERGMQALGRALQSA